MSHKADPEVEYMIENYKRLEALRLQLKKDNGFLHTRSQDFKKCALIKWRFVNKKDEINYDRLKELSALSNDIIVKYDLREEKHPLCDIDLLLAKVGIYSFSEWSYRAWAIPNSNVEVQAYILSKLPEWAELKMKD